jgi:hypothetical protein
VAAVGLRRERDQDSFPKREHAGNGLIVGGKAAQSAVLHKSHSELICG